jgi:hypothetical protein
MAIFHSHVSLPKGKPPFFAVGVQAPWGPQHPPALDVQVTGK